MCLSDDSTIAILSIILGFTSGVILPGFTSGVILFGFTSGVILFETIGSLFFF
jgi:predicted permease